MHGVHVGQQGCASMRVACAQLASGVRVSCIRGSLRRCQAGVTAYADALLAACSASGLGSHRVSCAVARRA